ncbi:MAG: hypothetical protein JWN72_1546 [Thermoleophilia bacterium]|nr:hypothetical protein [Thermoleophilia bacterium]
MVIEPYAGLSPRPVPQARPDHFQPRNPASTSVIALVHDVPGSVGEPAQVTDLNTGLGRVKGYDSLANARRAAYMLTRGTPKGAAGIFQQGERFFVRAVGAYAAHGTDVVQLKFEGTRAAVAGVLDLRLRMLVDGSTKLFF